MLKFAGKPRNQKSKPWVSLDQWKTALTPAGREPPSPPSGIGVPAQVWPVAPGTVVNWRSAAWAVSMPPGERSAISPTRAARVRARVAVRASCMAGHSMGEIPAHSTGNVSRVRPHTVTTPSTTFGGARSERAGDSPSGGHDDPTSHERSERTRSVARPTPGTTARLTPVRRPDSVRGASRRLRLRLGRL